MVLSSWSWWWFHRDKRRRLGVIFHFLRLLQKGLFFLFFGSSFPERWSER